MTIVTLAETINRSYQNQPRQTSVNKNNSKGSSSDVHRVYLCQRRALVRDDFLSYSASVVAAVATNASTQGPSTLTRSCYALLCWNATADAERSFSSWGCVFVCSLVYRSPVSIPPIHCLLTSLRGRRRCCCRCSCHSNSLDWSELVTSSTSLSEMSASHRRPPHWVGWNDSKNGGSCE